MVKVLFVFVIYTVTVYCSCVWASQYSVTLIGESCKETAVANFKANYRNFLWKVVDNLCSARDSKRILWICGNKMSTRCNRWFLLQILLLAQHVSGTIMPIIRSSRVLYRWLLPLVFGALVFKLSVRCGAEERHAFYFHIFTTMHG